MSFVVAGALVVAALLALALARAGRQARGLERALARARGELEHLERAFGRFAPPDVVDRITAGATDLAPERRDVTVLFADLKGFTKLSEKYDPAVMVKVLNGYFRAMHDAIGAHHGRVSRIMGDGLLALFGAMDDNPWHAQDSVRAALAMRVALAAYNEKLAAESLPALAFGVGIHRGPVVAGIVGSSELMEFTVIGDPVNVAARVETLTRTHDADILVTEDVRRDLDARFRLRVMPLMPVKGKSEPIPTYAVESFDSTAAIAG